MCILLFYALGPVATNFSKIANVKFHAREADSMQIAKYAIKQLEKNKFYIIPGIDIKLVKFFSKFVPNNILAKVAYKIQKRKLQ